MGRVRTHHSQEYYVNCDCSQCRAAAQDVACQELSRYLNKLNRAETCQQASSSSSYSIHLYYHSLSER